MADKNWIGNKKSTFVTLGSSSHSEHTREKNDYYATDPKTIDDLLKITSIHSKVWEPSCGEGHLSKKLEEAGKTVLSTDLVYRGYGKGGINFLNIKKDKLIDADIITNPPYKYAQDFIEKSMELIKPGRKVIMFLKVLFLEGVKRHEMFQKYPPKFVHVYSKRQLCALGGDFKKGMSSATAYAWFEWEKGYTGPTQIKWIDPKGE